MLPDWATICYYSYIRHTVNFSSLCYYFPACLHFTVFLFCILRRPWKCEMTPSYSSHMQKNSEKRSQQATNWVIENSWPSSKWKWCLISFFGISTLQQYLFYSFILSLRRSRLRARRQNFMLKVSAVHTFELKQNFTTFSDFLFQVCVCNFTSSSIFNVSLKIVTVWKFWKYFKSHFGGKIISLPN